MNKVNPKSFTGGDFVDEDALAMERVTKSALAMFPKGPEPVKKGTKVPKLPKPTVD